MMTPLDRLKLARDDFDQQEKLYNTLALGQRFYVGVVALLGGWSLSLVKIEALDSRRDTVSLIGATAVFWVVLCVALYHLFQLFRGDHWTIPRTLDHYLKWEQDQLKPLMSGDYEIGGKTPAEYAEDEMLKEMMGAYADAACVNRAANLKRQKRVTKVGKVLLLTVLALGIQGVARIIYEQRHGKQSGQPAQATAAPASPGAGRHD